MNPVVKITKVEVENGARVAQFFCPGCRAWKTLWLKPEQSPSGYSWDFNDNIMEPTFYPSIAHSEKVKVASGETFERRCHAWIKDGVIQFLGDSTHELAGQKIPMIQLEDPPAADIRTETGPDQPGAGG
jgi:hypothetical protein